MKVAWHEVPGTRPRGVRLRRGRCEWRLHVASNEAPQIVQTVTQPIVRGGPQGSSSYRTVWDGSVCPHFPGTSCQATIDQSLRDENIRTLR
jgi:hypothetical protein